MPHYIMDNCTGCTICELKCPTQAITGVKKDKFQVVFQDLCIDCGVCGRWCPVNAILDQKGDVVPRYKASEIPKAVVNEEACVGCEICTFSCPFDCITMQRKEVAGAPHQFSFVAVVDPKPCVGCQICERDCGYDAITIPGLINMKEVVVSDMKIPQVWEESQLQLVTINAPLPQGPTAAAVLGR